MKPHEFKPGDEIYVNMEDRGYKNAVIVGKLNPLYNYDGEPLATRDDSYWIKFKGEKVKGEKVEVICHVSWIHLNLIKYIKKKRNERS